MHMSFEEALVTCFRKYADFTGRARRSEYWYFYLFDALVSAGLAVIFGEDSAILALYSLAVLLPGLAVTWRRLHDIGKSGLWALISIIPLIGGLLLLVWTCRDSEAGANTYGENPKV